MKNITYEDLQKQSEKNILHYAKLWKKYRFYKRNKWVYYLPFMQIKYNWIIGFGEIYFNELESNIRAYKLFENLKGVKL